MLSTVHVMGDYWHETAPELSALGMLIAAAKDEQSAPALQELSARMVRFAGSLRFPDGGVVVAVPPGPDRTAHPVPALASAVGASLGFLVETVVSRRLRTARLRDTEVSRRRAVVEAAGYSVVGDVVGRRLVLVDDVILTGTTLEFLAELLVDAGAERVDAVVAARTRLDQPGR